MLINGQLSIAQVAIAIFPYKNIHSYTKLNYAVMVSIILLYRIHKAVDDKAYVVDVDGSYLYKKYQPLKKT